MSSTISPGPASFCCATAAPEELQAIVDALEAEARARLTADGFAPERIEIRRGASLHYQGQSFELRVPLASGRLDRAALAALEEAFGAEHERTYGHRAGVEEPVELVSLEVVGRGLPETPRAASAAAAGLAPDIAIAEPRRSAYFGPGKRLARRRIAQPQRPARRRAPARASSRNTIRPAWSRRAGPPASTRTAISRSRAPRADGRGSVGNAVQRF